MSHLQVRICCVEHDLGRLAFQQVIGLVDLEGGIAQHRARYRIALGIGGGPLGFAVPNDQDIGAQFHVLRILAPQARGPLTTATAAIVSPEEQQGGVAVPRLVEGSGLAGGIEQFKVRGGIATLQRNPIPAGAGGTPGPSFKPFGYVAGSRRFWISWHARSFQYSREGT